MEGGSLYDMLLSEKIIPAAAAEDDLSPIEARAMQDAETARAAQKAVAARPVQKDKAVPAPITQAPAPAQADREPDGSGDGYGKHRYNLQKDRRTRKSHGIPEERTQDIHGSGCKKTDRDLPGEHREDTGYDGDKKGGLS